jgi:Family of unknown function (DUF6504)
MRGIGCEPVEVWLRDGRPERFVWRDRIYFVLFVRDTRTFPRDEPAIETATDATAPAETADRESAEAGDVSPGREVWIVEATAQRSVPARSYELCHDLKSDRWSLSRG